MAEPEAVHPLFVAGAAARQLRLVPQDRLWRRLLTLFARPAAWRILEAIVGATMLTMAAALMAHAPLEAPL